MDMEDDNSDGSIDDLE